MKMVCLS